IFDTVSVTTNGGPVDATRVLQLYIYDKAFTQFDFGYGAALSVALLLVLMVVTYVQYRVTRAGQTDLNYELVSMTATTLSTESRLRSPGSPDTVSKRSKIRPRRVLAWVRIYLMIVATLCHVFW